MEYVDVEQARNMSGVRLVLSMGFPGPWGQAVKKMLEYKGIAYIPVAQHVGRENAELVAWTGHRNAPVIVADGHPPLARWIDQIMFAERTAPNQPLLPSTSLDRALVFGIINELAGEWGLGWTRRLMLFDERAANVRAEPVLTTMGVEYGYDPQSTAAAPGRVADILTMLSGVLHRQRDAGSDYLVGGRLTAADIYWAAFSTMIEPLPDRLAPMTEDLRRAGTPTHPLIVEAKDPILIEHRTRMFDRHLGPIDF